MPAYRLFPQEAKSKPLIMATCYAGNKVKRIYVPPPKEYYSQANRKGGATITVKYSGFPAGAQAAVEYAARILESILPAGININVLATWEKITTAGVLAQASTTDLISGWDIDAQVPYAMYPIALAEKISGKSLNKVAEADIVLFVNNSVNWYLGTDGKTLSLKYDLVTVVLHELIHGLGFIDSMAAGTTTASYGVSGVPMIYDTFVENAAGKRLTDTLAFRNPSIELLTALTSGQLYFNGPLIKYYSGARARLYAPATYDAGSSVSHLDENTYVTVNSLMTPIIDMGEAVHDPGKFTMSILGDLGWVNTRIIHTKPRDTEVPISSLSILASVKSDTVYNHNKVSVVWSFDDFKTSSSTLMYSPLSNNNYAASIPISGYNIRLQYYISAEDFFGRVYKMPSSTDKFHFSVYIGTDTVKPVITHTRLSSFFEKAAYIKFDATVTDNIAVDTVYLEYILNDGTPNYLGLVSSGKDEFINSINPKDLMLVGGDSVRYRIIAIDKAASPNQRVLPSAGWYTIKIEPLNPVSQSYKTDFSAASADFLNDGFTISKPSGFSTNGLNTPHPYVSPENTGDSLGNIATLRTPLKLNAGGMMVSFNEVVLVEPGEAGSVYGSPNFYDYVIVEGSKDYGLSWFPVADGYDSRYYDAWLKAYNSSSDGTNSTFVPDASLILKHYFFVRTSSTLLAGDTIMVRFRLFSDPFAHGWGWFIGNLNIEPLIDVVTEVSYPELVLFPNPGDGIFTVRYDGKGITGTLRYSIFNSSGICILSGTDNSANELNLNISGFPPGIYFIVLNNSKGVRSVKYNLVK